MESFADKIKEIKKLKVDKNTDKNILQKKELNVFFANEQILIDYVNSVKVTYFDGSIKKLSKYQWIAFRDGIVKNMYYSGKAKIEIILK